MATDTPNAADDSGSFDGRFLVEIKAWDGNLHVGLSSEPTPQEHRFQGGLTYVRGFDIDGRIVAPKVHRSRVIRLWLSPFGPELRFSPNEMDEVGRLYFPSPRKPDLSARLMIPEAALAMTATCLGSVWKYTHIWTFDEDVEQASIKAFSFSSTVHRNLDAWVEGD